MTEEELTQLVVKIRQAAEMIARNASIPNPIHPTSTFGADNIWEDAVRLHKLAIQLKKETR